MRRTETLYTYDNLTMLTLEALLCGCRVILLPENRELDMTEPLCGFIHDDFDSQLDRFIS